MTSETIISRPDPDRMAIVPTVHKSKDGKHLFYASIGIRWDAATEATILFEKIEHAEAFLEMMTTAIAQLRKDHDAEPVPS